MDTNLTEYLDQVNEDTLGMTFNVTNNAMPPDYYLRTQFICDRILMPIVCSIGIVGNILSLIVLTRKEMSSATNCFLTGLGVSDLSLLIVQLPVFLEFSDTLKQNDDFVITYRHYIIARYVFTNLFITCTCWITIAVTIERFTSLCYLMNANMTCTIMRSRITIVCIFIVSSIFHFSKFFEYTPNYNTSEPNPLLLTPLVKNSAYETYVHISQITLTAILPVITLIFFNSILVYFLSWHRRQMARRTYRIGSIATVDMIHITIVVVSMVLVFIFCHSIGVYLAISIAINGRKAIFGNPVFRSLKHVNTLLVMVNSSINFLLYCAISKKFRTTFSMVFLDKIMGKKTSWSYKHSLTDQTLSTKMPVMSFISHSASSSSNKSGDNSEV